MLGEPMPFREPKQAKGAKRAARRSLEVQGIPSRLIALRREKDLGQVELDELAGVGQGTLSKIEKGTRWPDVETLFRYARALQVNIHWLVTGNGPRRAEFETPLELPQKQANAGSRQR